MAEVVDQSLIVDDAAILASLEREAVQLGEKVSAKAASRIELFLKALRPPEISLPVIQSLAFQGIPDEAPGLRAVYWKLLLGYLPLDRNKWRSSLASSREVYAGFRRDLLARPHVSDHEGTPCENGVSLDTRTLERKTLSVVDHPLSIDRQSEWSLFFKSKEVWEEIDKDVRRTRPEMHFFFLPSSGVATQDLEHDTHEKHSDVLGRILFIFAKLNPGIRYVQGMNEILAPIYYLFATDLTACSREHAEADAFFCFTTLMGEVKDSFLRSLDSTESGIRGRITQLNQFLRRKDEDLWRHLDQLQINPQFYSLRWIMLLLTQEFEMPDIMRLWDSLLADPKRFEFLFYFCCAMIITVRGQLFEGDFADNMHLLQRYPPTDLRQLLETAIKLRNSDLKSTASYASSPEDPSTSG
eukprot:GILK01004662.1.p1 GENE.GILK01004662.1~~GILK01004662.1.p1  ORF type:complete len:427 (-),score=50.89 GILK01004662.1:40-1275(-)